MTGLYVETFSWEAETEETSTRPVGRCLTSVYLQYWRASLGTHLRHGRSLCSVAPSGQAPTPPSGAPKARGLRAKARTEQTSMLPRCAVIRHCPRDRVPIFTPDRRSHIQNFCRRSRRLLTPIVPGLCINRSTMMTGQTPFSLG